MNLPPTLCLMLKAPRPGFVKTRLAADLGNEAVAQVYRHLVEHQAAQMPREWRVEVHFTPADADAEMRAWLQPLLPTETTFFAQPDGDLGARLRAALAGAASRGANEILFAGGDCPELTADKLNTAARALQTTPFVIIPATDGGYVLIGLAAPRFFIFDDIAWSTPQVFEQTQQRIQSRGYGCKCFTPVEDVDDLHALRERRIAVRASLCLRIRSRMATAKHGIIDQISFHLRCRRATANTGKPNSITSSIAYPLRSHHRGRIVRLGKNQTPRVARGCDFFPIPSRTHPVAPRQSRAPDRMPRRAPSTRGREASSASHSPPVSASRSLKARYD